MVNIVQIGVEDYLVAGIVKPPGNETIRRLTTFMVMNALRIFLLLLMVTPFCTFAQLQGKYCRIGQYFGAECYTFLDNNRFEYEWEDVDWVSRGTGTYTTDDYVITFNFIGDTVNFPEYVVEIDTLPENGDSITLNLKLLTHKFKKPITGDASLKNLSTTRKHKTMLNYDGFGHFTVPRNTVQYDLHIVHHQDYSYSMLLTADYNYNITVYRVGGNFFNHVYVTGENRSFIYALTDKKRTLVFKKGLSDEMTVFEKREEGEKGKKKK